MCAGRTVCLTTSVTVGLMCAGRTVCLAASVTVGLMCAGRTVRLAASVTVGLLLVQVKTVIFDKTGTLTHGKPVVTRTVLFVAKSVCPFQLFTAIVGLAESNSEHPLGVAVTNFAKRVSTGMKHGVSSFYMCCG